MEFENLSVELQEKLKACETEEELRALVEAEGLTLTDSQLEAISGGKLVCIGRDGWVGEVDAYHCPPHLREGGTANSCPPHLREGGTANSCPPHLR